MILVVIECPDYVARNYLKESPKSGELLVIFGFTNNAGGLSPLVEFAQKANALMDTLDIEAMTQILVPIAAGTNTGSVTITVRYKNAAAWADAGAKQQASQEWGALFATFPNQDYPNDYQAMSFVVQ